MLCSDYKACFLPPGVLCIDYKAPFLPPGVLCIDYKATFLPPGVLCSDCKAHHRLHPFPYTLYIIRARGGLKSEAGANTAASVLIVAFPIAIEEVAATRFVGIAALRT